MCISDEYLGVAGAAGQRPHFENFRSRAALLS